MRPYRPLRTVLFIYETARFIIIMTLPRYVAGALSGGADSGIFSGADFPFPFAPSAAANALFPLIAFFLRIRFTETQGSLFLYIAGKAIFVAASIAWLCFSAKAIVAAVIVTDIESLFILLWVSLLLFFDTLTIVSGLLLNLKARRMEGPREPPPAETDTGAQPCA